MKCASKIYRNIEEGCVQIDDDNGIKLGPVHFLPHADDPLENDLEENLPRETASIFIPGRIF